MHKIRPSVIHLMRGQIYEIDGKSFFTFGGASSHDIESGILDPEDPNFKEKKKWLDREWRSYRVNHITWWVRELPSEEDASEAVPSADVPSAVVPSDVVPPAAVPSADPVLSVPAALLPVSGVAAFRPDSPAILKESTDVFTFESASSVLTEPATL